MKSQWKKNLLYASILIVGALLIWFLVQPALVNNSGFENKTTWDRMELLVIPLVLTLGAFYLERSERITEREIANDNQRDATLQAYIDRMAELLVYENLQTTKKKSVRDIARTRTLTVLRRLDGKRKGQVLQFLHDANLISKSAVVVDLSRSDLSGTYLPPFAKLRDVYLPFAQLDDAYLFFSDLTGANLEHAKLVRANLSLATLNDANLRGAFLNLTHLHGANLKGARLAEAVMEGANLEGAEVTSDQLAQAKSLKGATMPDGTKHE